MPLPPHELIQTGRQHVLMDPLHPLEFSLYAVPVGFHVLGVDSCGGIYKEEGMVDRAVGVDR